MIDITKPIYPTLKGTPEYVRCSNIKKKSVKEEIDNPFAHILAKECANWFNHSKMFGFYHLNSIITEDILVVKKALKRENMYLKQYGKKIVKEAIIGTPYEAVMNIFESHTYILFSEEIKPATMLNIMKKCPQLIFLGNILFISNNK